MSWERVKLNIPTIEREKLPINIIYPAKLFFRYDGEIKTFPDKQKLRKFTTTRCALPKKKQQKELFCQKEKGKRIQNSE